MPTLKKSLEKTKKIKNQSYGLIFYEQNFQKITNNT